MNFEVLYQDEDVVVVNKPGGLLVHRSSQSSDRIFLLQELRNQLGKHLYPVHRLDRPTSGVIAFAFSSEAARDLQSSLSAEDSSKEYIAFVRGEAPEEGEMTRPLRNDKGEPQPCSTSFKRIAYWSRSSLLKVKITTGRRHQIRRHMAHLALHVLGDTTYGKGRINRAMRENYGLPRLFLHAQRLKLVPFRNNKGLDIRAPLFNDLREFLLRLPDCDPALIESL
ncbi:MAG: pseudouridine synthase [Planctomycetota bacterium]|nr:pseudouridine synthase [Planctomycetota bacterium]